MASLSKLNGWLKVLARDKHSSLFAGSVTRLSKILPFSSFSFGIIFNFTNKYCQNMVCCTYFNFQKKFDITIIIFESEFLYFGDIFGHIYKSWVIFFQSSGHSVFR